LQRRHVDLGDLAHDVVGPRGEEIGLGHRVQHGDHGDLRGPRRPHAAGRVLDGDERVGPGLAKRGDAHLVALRVGLAGGRLVGADDGGDARRHAHSSEKQLDLVAQRARHDRHRPGVGARRDERRPAVEEPRVLGVPEVHGLLRLDERSHPRLARVLPGVAQDGPERAGVIEREVAPEVVRLGQHDAQRQHHLGHRAVVQVLVVHEHPVEIEQRAEGHVASRSTTAR
jgi:hypothetical protein